MYPAQICNISINHNQFLEDFFTFKWWLEAEAYFRRRRALLIFVLRIYQLGYRDEIPKFLIFDMIVWNKKFCLYI